MANKNPFDMTELMQLLQPESIAKLLDVEQMRAAFDNFQSTGRSSPGNLTPEQLRAMMFASQSAGAAFESFSSMQQSIHADFMRAAAHAAKAVRGESPTETAIEQLQIYIKAMTQGQAMVSDLAAMMTGESSQALPPDTSLSFHALANTALNILSQTAESGQSESAAFAINPQAWRELQTEYMQRLSSLLTAEPENARPSDSRFDSEQWQQLPYSWYASIYEMNAQYMARMAQAVQGGTKRAQQFQFAIDQMIDAMSPENFLATNPQAQRAFVESGGASLQAGMENLADDIRKGSISQTDDTAFDVGTNLAITPGHVVYENDLIQLIQYTPLTNTVSAVPLLIVPPCINKFYVLDLQPHNSLVRWLVEQRVTVFLISWRNVQQEQGHLTWDNYLDDGVCTAIEVTRTITEQDQIDALGFCVGGTLLSTAMAALAARDQRPVRSLTLLTTLLDFEESGVLNALIDEPHVAMREATIGQGGILPGAELAQTFSSLRARDLIWNYVSRNYLQGKKPSAYDLLYWNSDSTNLPGPAFAWYLRHMYLLNQLCRPGEVSCLNESIDLALIDCPVFIYGSRDDHIVPWRAAYASRQLLGAESTFVLGSSGHIAGVINPPAARKRHHWVGDSDSPDSNDWLEQATQVGGSWWPYWIQWLNKQGDEQITARVNVGGNGYAAIEVAPGRYVKEQA